MNVSHGGRAPPQYHSPSLRSHSICVMAEDKGAVPTNSNTYLKILQKLVELWRRANMNETPVKEHSSPLRLFHATNQKQQR